MSKLERNLAWIYVNGAKGGGGSGGGETTEYTITVSEGSTVYTTTPNVTLNILIKSGGVKKSFTVVAKKKSQNQPLVMQTQTRRNSPGLILKACLP